MLLVSAVCSSLKAIRARLSLAGNAHSSHCAINLRDLPVVPLHQHVTAPVNANVGELDPDGKNTGLFQKLQVAMIVRLVMGGFRCQK